MLSNTLVLHVLFLSSLALAHSTALPPENKEDKPVPGKLKSPFIQQDKSGLEDIPKTVATGASQVPPEAKVKARNPLFAQMHSNLSRGGAPLGGVKPMVSQIPKAGPAPQKDTVTSEPPIFKRKIMIDGREVEIQVLGSLKKGLKGPKKNYPRKGGRRLAATPPLPPEQDVRLVEDANSDEQPNQDAEAQIEDLQISKIAMYNGAKELTGHNLPIDNNATLWLQVADKKKIKEAKASLNFGLGTPTQEVTFIARGHKNWFSIELGRLAPGTHLEYSVCISYESSGGEIVSECQENKGSQFVDVETSAVVDTVASPANGTNERNPQIYKIAMYNGATELQGNNLPVDNKATLWLQVADKKKIKEAKATFNFGPGKPNQEMPFKPRGHKNWFSIELGRLAPGTHLEYSVCVSYESSNREIIEECQENKPSQFVDVEAS